MTDSPTFQALTRGRLPNIDAVAQVRHSTGPAGRAIDVATFGGLSLRILPDRGLDILNVWFAGVPLAWISKTGEAAPLTELSGFAWSSAFGGGLLTTCGLRNVGMPSEGHGLHGTYSHLPASEIESVIGDDGSVTLRAEILDPARPGPLVVTRTITSAANRAHLTITDETVNLGSEPVDSPLLYHLNFGYPLWSGAAELEIDALETTARDSESERSLESWSRPAALEAGPERVLEHTVQPKDGWGGATILNHEMGISVAIGWRMAELGRLHQWIDPNPGMAVLGIEPANCSTSGRAHDRGEGRLPSMVPGETRSTVLTVEAARL